MVLSEKEWYEHIVLLTGSWCFPGQRRNVQQLREATAVLSSSGQSSITLPQSLRAMQALDVARRACSLHETTLVLHSAARLPCKEY
jgi:hypothetical protein